MSRIFQALKKAGLPTPDFGPNAIILGEEPHRAVSSVEETQKRAVVAGANSAGDRTVDLTAAPKVARAGGMQTRAYPRSNFAVPALLRLLDSEPEKEFEEVLTTENTSRGGVYVKTPTNSYREDMLVEVTFPYTPGMTASSNEYIGQVVRVDRLEDWQIGVAVELLGSAVAP